MTEFFDSMEARSHHCHQEEGLEHSTLSFLRNGGKLFMYKNLLQIVLVQNTCMHYYSVVYCVSVRDA